MGAYFAEFPGRGATLREALASAVDLHYAEYKDDVDSDGKRNWPDPWDKPGCVLAWDKPVDPDAVDWMIGWCNQNPPEGVDPWNKWGPWLAFPLAAGGWLFFGWVNT